MKFKIVAFEDNLYLLSCDGSVNIISEKSAAELIFHYDTFNTETFAEVGTSCILDEEKSVPIVTLQDDNTLEIHNANFLRRLMFPNEFPYLTPDEFAEKNKRQGRIVRRLCTEGRIEGAVHIGQTWFIPRFAEYPKDKRAGRDMSKRVYTKNNS